MSSFNYLTCFLEQMFLFHIYLKHYQLLDFLWRDLLNSLARELILCGCFRERKRSQLLSLIDASRQDKEKNASWYLGSFYLLSTYCMPAALPKNSRFGDWEGAVMVATAEMCVVWRGRGGETWGRFILPDHSRTWPHLKFPEERLVCAETYMRSVKQHLGWISLEGGNLQIRYEAGSQWWVMGPRS